MRRTFGFSSGAAPRVAIAVAWGVLAVCAVLLLDRQPAWRPTPTTSPRPSASREQMPQGEVSVEITAGFRVAQWNVSAGAEAVDPESRDPGTWRGTARRGESTTRLELFVDAQSEDLFADHRHALRVVLQDNNRRAEQTVWGDGDVSVLIDVEEWFNQ